MLSWYFIFVHDFKYLKATTKFLLVFFSLLSTLCWLNEYLSECKTCLRFQSPLDPDRDLDDLRSRALAIDSHNWPFVLLRNQNGWQSCSIVFIKVSLGNVMLSFKHSKGFQWNRAGSIKRLRDLIASLSLVPGKTSAYTTEKAAPMFEPLDFAGHWIYFSCRVDLSH